MIESPLEGLCVVAKFYNSKAPDGSIHCISRTLGKLSVIETSHAEKVQHKDIWVCRIRKELHAGLNRGAFILEPLEKLESPEMQIKKVIPGFYDVSRVGKAAVVRPNESPESYWMLSKVTRQLFADKFYAVVVPITYPKSENQ